MEDEKYQVNIPANVKTRTELINGFGISELIITVVAGVISIMIDLIIYAIIKNYLVCIIVFGIITGGMFVAQIKDKNNSCIADMIINIYRYTKEQKYFEYTIKEKE